MLFDQEHRTRKGQAPRLPGKRTALSAHVRLNPVRLQFAQATF